MRQLLVDERQCRERFYDEVSDDTKAEFINGQVLMHSPATLEHLNSRRMLVKLLDTYVETHNLGLVLDEKCLICLNRNDYEPDVCFFGEKKAADIKKGQMKYPAPDFIVEVLSRTTEKNDRGVKFEDYASSGVREYWLVDTQHERIEQYEARGEEYHLVTNASKGSITSLTVKGFTIPIHAIFDRKANLAALRKLMA